MAKNNNGIVHYLQWHVAFTNNGMKLFLFFCSLLLGTERDYNSSRGLTAKVMW